MDESALRIALTALDTSWCSLEHWLWGCALLVFIGVTVEVVPIALEYRTDWLGFCKGIIHSPEEPPKAKFAMSLAGCALVAIGVFGEFFVGIKMAKVETDMRDDTAKLVSIVDDRAAKAEKEAAQLEALTAPRRLTLEQQKAIAGALHRFAGRSVVVNSYVLDTGAQTLGEQICAAFRSAKIYCLSNPGSVSFIGGKPLSGIKVFGVKSQSDFRSEIELSLKSDAHLEMAGPEQHIIPTTIGSQATEFVAPSARPTDASIFVGVKPVVVLTPP